VRIDPTEYHRENRCPGCRLTRRLCICGELPTVAIPLELVVLQHESESESLSNTGTLTTRMLAPSRLVRYPGDVDDALRPPGLLLYPQSNATPLTPAHLARAERIVILDATWRRARRMYRKTPALRELETVTVVGIEPRWVLRRPPAPGMLNTAEAVAAALAAIGAEEAAEALHRVLADFMPRALHCARKIPYADVPRGGSMRADGAAPGRRPPRPE